LLIRLLVIANLILATLSLAGCHQASKHSEQEATAKSGQAKKITICLLPKIKGISYFSSCYKGAMEAALELGNVELIYDGPTDGDPKKQAEMIDQWVVDGVDAICVSPNAPDVVATAMAEARAAGVKVITWDADSSPASREFFVNQATAPSIGGGMVNAMIKDLGPEVVGDVVIISSDATSANQNAWIDEMKSTLSKSKLKLATIKYPGENASNALADAMDVIKKYPELKGIFGISSVSFPGAAEGVEQMGKSGLIMVTGLSTPNDMKSFVKKGTVKSVILWNTIDLGYLTVYVGDALVRGTLKKGMTTLPAGRLGDKQIDGDNVMLGDIMVFTKDNIDQHNF